MESIDTYRAIQEFRDRSRGGVRLGTETQPMAVTCNGAVLYPPQGHEVDCTVLWARASTAWATTQRRWESRLISFHFFGLARTLTMRQAIEAQRRLALSQGGPSAPNTQMPHTRSGAIYNAEYGR